jgi:hypothetical protein
MKKTTSKPMKEILGFILKKMIRELLNYAFERNNLDLIDVVHTIIELLF